MHCPRLYNIFRLPAIRRRVQFVIYMAFPNLLVENIFSFFMFYFSPNYFSCLFTQTNLMITWQKDGRRRQVFLSLLAPTQTAKHPKLGNNNNKWFYRFGRKTIKNKDAGGRSLKVCSFELAQQCRLTPFRSEIGRNVLFCFHRSYGAAGGESESENEIKSFCICGLEECWKEREIKMSFGCGFGRKLRRWREFTF